jgi:integrase
MGTAERAEDLSRYTSVNKLLNKANHGLASESTLKNMISALRQVCTRLKMNPDEILSFAKRDPDEFEMRLNAMNRQMISDGYSMRSVGNYYFVIIQLLKANGIDIGLKGLPKRATRVPPGLTREQIKRIVQEADPRTRAFICTMKDSGLSPVDILQLNYGSIKDEFEEGKMPLMLKLRRRKTGILFNTFLGEDAVEYLKRYFEIRKKGTVKSYGSRGEFGMPPEKIVGSSPLFTVMTRRGRSSRMTYRAIQIGFKQAAERAGINDVQIYDLRRFFITKMKGQNINDTLVEKWSGHKLPGVSDSYFAPTSEDLGKERGLYLSAYSSLSIEQGVDEKKQALQQAKVSLGIYLKMAGYSDDTISEASKKIDELTQKPELLQFMTQDQIFELVRKEVVIGEARDMGAIEVRLTEEREQREKLEREVASLKQALESLTTRKKDKQTKRKGKKGQEEKLVEDIVKRL